MSPFKGWGLFVAALLFAGALSTPVLGQGGGGGGQKQVQVSLTAPWGNSPLVMEASEYWEDDTFWKFVEALPAGAAVTSDKVQFDAVGQAGLAITTEDQVKLLEFALALRSSSPKLEMHRSTWDSAYTLGCSIASPDGAVAVVGDKCITDASALREAVQRCSSSLFLSEKNIMFHTMDRIHPSSPSASAAEGVPPAILYATVGTKAFLEFHKELKALAAEGAVRYALRHTWSGWRKEKSSDCTGEELPLQGYGVELAVKNMEYKAVDDAKVDASREAIGGEEEAGEVGGFDFKVLLGRRPELKEELLALRDELSAEVSKSDDIKVWALKDLGIQASQHIMLSKEPLKLMRDLSHNLPSLVSTISRLKVNKEMQKEIEANHQFMHPGSNLVLLNGRMLDPMETTPFGLLDTLKVEVKAMERLTSSGMDVVSARKLLLGSDDARARRQGGMGGMAEDEFKLDINVKPHVMWINDLEKDSRYEQWPRGIEGLLSRGWPGQLKYVAKNLYHAIYVLDPSQRDSWRAMKVVSESMMQSLPVRFGFIFSSTEALAAHESGRDKDTVDVDNIGEGEQFYRLLNALYTRHGSEAAAAFINSYMSKAVDLGNPEQREEARKEAFRRTAKNFKAKVKDAEGKLRKAKYKETLNATNASEGLVESTRFVRSAGLDPSSSPVLVVNGDVISGWDEEHLIQTVQVQQQLMQRRAYFQEINSQTDIYRHVVSGDNVYKRFQPQVVSGPQSSTLYLSDAAVDLATHNLTWINCKTAATGGVRPISHIVAVDMASEASRQLVMDAAERLSQGGGLCGKVRLALVDNSAGSRGDASEALDAVVRAGTKLAAGEELVKVVKEVCKAMREGAWQTAGTNPLLSEYLSGVKGAGGREVAEGMGILLGEGGVATAGRVFRVRGKDTFAIDDFALAEEAEWSSRAKHVYSVVVAAEWPKLDKKKVNSKFKSDAVLRGSVTIGLQSTEGIARQQIPQQWSGQMSGFTVGTTDALLQVTAFLDPLSLGTQRMAPLLMALSSAFGAHIQVFLNPSAVINDIPIKGYFRYVLSSGLNFNDDGSIKAQHKASFSNLPTTKLLTMNIHPPDAWFVEASRCAYDMDNILLDSLPESESVLSAHYTLDHILLTGSATNEQHQPPAGLQLNLEPSGRPGEAISDTTVMSNLGYFQLKARPGVWVIQTPPTGLSRDIYEIKGRDQGGMEVALSSFEPKDLRVSAVKRAGREDDSLISEDQVAESQDSSLWGSFSGMFSSTTGTGSQVAEAGGGMGANETIHVFSLASGHLYERFLKIMMLSVVRNTKAPVKFWLLRNFLSPGFKQSIGAFAKKHGFEYELVTYKWPSWLHGQTEKQRIIWGYKILMLDVLFPLSVNKIIYIDSDQVVRADLTELWKMDLKGRSLAYTPFCDSNKEMEGYRFWKQGFWQSHLGSNKYHISALYVVDLKRFRQQGHGDQLRVIYSQLSRDPNSLANLDQDLPNYAQHQVPIFSLPQEWLWCETWCGKDTKATAKTIDLCNNPMTKEPKLDQAKRIVSEWVELDELRGSTDKIVADEITAE